MNKTLSIGLAGYSFIIEEFAYIKLNDYLNALRNSLETNEIEEVMHDIEIRIVEIFRESLGSREVVNDADVQKVIAQLGTPEVIEEQEETYYSESVKVKPQNTTQKRQLFRDPEHIKIAGVCAGMAHFVGIDIGLMRAIWLFIAIMGVFTAAISTTFVLLLYIVLWIVLPKANSASDFLKMKGKPVDFDNIKKESIKFANESSQRVGEFYQNNRKEINDAGNRIWRIIRYMIGGFCALIALGCLFGVGLGVSLLVGNVNIEPAMDLDFYLNRNFDLYIVATLIILGSLLPTVLFTMLAIKFISPKTSVKIFGWIMAGVFLLIVLIGSIFGYQMMNFKENANIINSGEKVETEEIAISTTSDTILLDVKQVEIPKNFISYRKNGQLFSDKKEVYEKEYHHDWDNIEVDITRTENIITPYLIVKKEAKGYNQPIRLNVPFEVINNRILLPNYIKYPYTDRFRGYEVSYELVVPQRFSIVTQNPKISIDEDDDFQQGNSAVLRKNHDHKTASVNIGGTQIDIDTNNPNRIKINGRDFSPKEAERYAEDSLQIDLTDLLNIDIDNGRLRIKTR